MLKWTFPFLCCFFGMGLMQADKEETAAADEEWHELPVNKLTKMLQLVKETEKKESKQEKWAKTAKDNFWRKELRKITRKLDDEPYEMRLVEGSTVHLECPARETLIQHESDFSGSSNETNADSSLNEANATGLLNETDFPVTFTWMRNGVVLEEETTDVSRITFISEHKITIYPADVGDSGRYACFHNDTRVAQVSLEILSIADAISEGFLVMATMVASTIPIYLILLLTNWKRVKPVEEILEEKEEKDVNLDERVDQIIAVLAKDNPSLRRKRRRNVSEQPEEEEEDTEE